MRIDARLGNLPRPMNVYHAEHCRMVQRVVWVDDKRACWGEYAWPLQRDGDHFRIRVHVARRIIILLSRQLVIINPVGFGEQTQDRRDVLVTPGTPMPRNA